MLGCASTCRQKIVQNRLVWSAKRASWVTAEIRRVKQGHPLMRIYIIAATNHAVPQGAGTLMTARLSSPRMRSCTLPPLSGQRYWAVERSAGVEKRKKVGDGGR